MKVARFEAGEAVRLAQKAALEELLAFDRQGPVRPCPGCGKTCPRCGSLACGCACGPDCPDEPRALSTDPDNFPIEAGIVPLVFALRKTALGQPCWSCEGHAGGDGGLWKRPGVWFYAAHQVAADLIAQHIWRLSFAGRLKLPWRVGLIATDNPLDTTFAIEPDCRRDAALYDLRRDVETIAATLPREARSLARQRLAALATGDKI